MGKQKPATENALPFNKPDEPAWMLKLECNTKTGARLNTIGNFLLILRNDPKLKGTIGLNQLYGRVAVKKDLPWKNAGTLWCDTDDAYLQHYFQHNYGIRSKPCSDCAWVMVANENQFHPIQDYLNALVWDGTPRIDTMLIDYLGADDTEYTRTVTRKMMTAGVKRVFEPGCKFDWILTLLGAQGIGKSTLFAKLAGKWFSSTFRSFNSKEAYEALQGKWFVELAELSAMRKAEIETIKDFASSQSDHYRTPYNRYPADFPRQSILVGTTNNDLFLKDETGNRRFWPVTVDIAKATKDARTGLTQDDIDQLWAEAFQAWKAGETVYLSNELEAAAALVQMEHTDVAPELGLIERYLTVHKKTKICTMELWVECLGGDKVKFPQPEKNKLNGCLRMLPGWKRAKGNLGFGVYGQQRGYVKIDSDETAYEPASDKELEKTSEGLLPREGEEIF